MTAANMVKWNPRDYAANSAAQEAWARELIGRLQLRGDESVLDVGCGDGRITALLARALPRGEIVGADTSEEMLAFARESFSAGDYPNLRFERMDARELRCTSPLDLIFSNAALHWVNDHPAFLRGAGACLKPGGRLVVSCGGKGNAHDVFEAVRRTLRLKRWREYFRELQAPYFFHGPAAYEKWLPRCGFQAQLVRLANKPTPLAGRLGLMSWLRTTWLPYTQRVPVEQREEFIAAVADRFLASHPPDAQGQLLIGMVRLEIDAIKTAGPGPVSNRAPECLAATP